MTDLNLALRIRVDKGQTLRDLNEVDRARAFKTLMEDAKALSRELTEATARVRPLRDAVVRLDGAENGITGITDELKQAETAFASVTERARQLGGSCAS